MSTEAPVLLRNLAGEWDSGMDYPSASFAGIVGDLAHAATGGYHISIIDQVDPNNYSIVRVDDKAPPGSWPRNCASAIDMSMSAADMVKCWDRLFAVWNNPADSRRKYINAINGWNGKGEAERLDFVSQTRKFASSDHKYHTHLEARRRYVNDPAAMSAIASILRGQPDRQPATTPRSNDVGFIVEYRSSSGDNADKKWYWSDGFKRRTILIWPEHEALGQATGRPDVVIVADTVLLDLVAGKLDDGSASTGMTQAAITSLAEQIAKKVVLSPLNGLTEADHQGVVADLKLAMREIFVN